MPTSTGINFSNNIQNIGTSTFLVTEIFNGAVAIRISIMMAWPMCSLPPIWDRINLLNKAIGI
jgi:hypothetical protein